MQYRNKPQLRDALAASDGSLPLPLIRNKKTVDPRDKNSPEVFQLETAMGAAIECFPDAGAIDVPRTTDSKTALIRGFRSEEAGQGRR